MDVNALHSVLFLHISIFLEKEGECLYCDEPMDLSDERLRLLCVMEIYPVNLLN